MKCVFVDDEPNLLNAMRRQLETEFAIETFNSAEKALASITCDPEVAVVVTDYKMPVMDGIQFLKALTTRSPNVVPIMLTGVGDLSTAMTALNDCRIFRFITKPCSPVELTRAISEGMGRFNHNKAERELMESTLFGCVKILTDILAMVDPIGFEEGRAIRNDLREVARKVPDVVLWEAELAGMLVEVGSLVLPTPFLIKLRTGQALSAEEERLWSRVPEVGAKLVRQVPRLERVAEIIERHREDYNPKGGRRTHEIPKGARLIRILKDLHALKGHGLSDAEALKSLEQRAIGYDGELLKVVKQHIESRQVKQVPIARLLPTELVDLAPGQKVMNDVKTTDGVLLIRSGMTLDETLIERVRNYSNFVGLKALPVIEYLSAD